VRRLIQWGGLTLIFLASCTRKEPIYSVVKMTDRSAESQLAGFYPTEATSRWTGPHFSAKLALPAGKTGAMLDFRFAIPESLLAKTGPLTLCAVVDERVSLLCQTYSKPGDYSYAADLPPNAANPVTLEFEVDKSIPPSSSDKRELSLLAQSVGVVAK
jgi:hypothetical protein